jgi:hypothetical protein
MKLFEFLERISQEKFPIRLEYNEKWINVEVDAFYERWVVSFDDEGFLDFEIFKDIDAPDNENADILEELFNRPEKSWKDAASDLGIEFIHPFKFIGTDNKEYEITGLLPQFGSKNGALITSRKDDEEALLEAYKLEDYCRSALNPVHYDRYNRKLFIETLKDWGWYSNEVAPAWFNE